MRCTPMLPEVQLAIQDWINGGLGKGSPSAPQILTLGELLELECPVDPIQVTEA